jgi:hypothetical protein
VILRRSGLSATDSGKYTESKSTRKVFNDAMYKLGRESDLWSVVP